ncbi:MAG: hypothetical protein GY930_10230 [bacterium]|nr:hypothetical protein [bacterium]
MRSIPFLVVAFFMSSFRGSTASAQSTRTVSLGANNLGWAIWKNTATGDVLVSGRQTNVPKLWMIASNDTIATTTLGTLAGGTTGQGFRFPDNGTS